LRRAPLELQNKPESLELLGEAPGTVDVRVRGASTMLGQLSQGDVVAVLDLSTARQGRRLFHLSPDHVRAPFGVEVTYVGPGTLPLVFERSGSKVIPVVPSIDGQPAVGHAVEKVTVEPAEVEVIGPESALRDLAQATTEPVEIENATTSVRETVIIGVPNSAARLRSPGQARVFVEIAPVRTERMFATVPVRMQNLRPGLSARSSPSNIAVTIRGDEELMKALTIDDIRATVDLAGLGAGQYTLAVRVAPSTSFAVARLDPVQVQITIR